MFYTDWKDLGTLAEDIKNDAASAIRTKRPLPADIFGMLERLEDMYAGAQNINVLVPDMKKVLNELMNAVLSNKVYQEAMFYEGIVDGGGFIKYCALYMLIFKNDSASLDKLTNLCEKFAPNLKFTDILKEYKDIAIRTELLILNAAAKLKEIHNSQQ